MTDTTGVQWALLVGFSGLTLTLTPGVPAILRTAIPVVLLIAAILALLGFPGGDA